MARTKNSRSSLKVDHKKVSVSASTTAYPCKTPTTPKKKRNVRPGICFNCGCDETETDLWRSDIFAPPGKKQMVCNACGLWSRDHGHYRPTHIWKHLKTRAEKVAGLEGTAPAGSVREGQQSHRAAQMFASSPSESSSPVSARSATPEYETYEGYASYARSPSKDDLFAATTLLAMNSLGIHGASPTSLRPSTSYEGPSFPRRHTDAEGQGWVSRAAQSGYVPSWMGPQSHRPMLPSTPTIRRYNTDPAYYSSPGQWSGRPSSSGSVTMHIVRPAVTNLCEPLSPTRSTPRLLGTRERRDSQASIVSSVLQTPEFGHQHSSLPDSLKEEVVHLEDPRLLR